MEDTYIILDLEYSTSCAYINKKYAKSIFPKFADRPSEIIEIGAIKLNKHLQIIDTFQCYIKPEIYKRVAKYVNCLTGITNELLQTGIHFKEAIDLFCNWIGNDNYILCTWGNLDSKVLKQNFLYHNINLEDLLDVENIIDVQNIFNNEKQTSLKNAIDNLNIEQDKPLHSAKNDAYFTAEVFKQIFNISSTQLLQVSNY